MLPAGHRLRRGADIATAVRGGRRATNPGPALLVVHLRAGELGSSAESPARVGFVVSGGVGGAVVRNRVKRRLRHLALARLDRLPAGTDLVVRALPASATAGYGELGRALDGAIERALRPGARRTEDPRRPEGLRR